MSLPHRPPTSRSVASGLQRLRTGDVEAAREVFRDGRTFGATFR